METEMTAGHDAGNIRDRTGLISQTIPHASPAIREQDALAVLDSYSGSSALRDELYVETWIQRVRDYPSLNTVIVPLHAVTGWNRNPQTGNISHDSGRFFSVIGLHARHRYNHSEISWDQPIIEQPEIGILGILAKTINRVLHFCLQAKEEPGNIGAAQLSPTVQATYSNYTGVHGGGEPLFLEYFLNPTPEKLLFARLQTEDGGRFLYKSNRNMIVSVGDDFPVELPDSFIWLTLKQISSLLDRDNLINACTRSILSSLFLAGSRISGSPGKDRSGGAEGDVSATPVHEPARSDVLPESGIDHGRPQDIRDTLQWFDDRKASNHITAQRIGLNDLQEWELDGKGFFSHKEKRFFRVVGLQVSSETGEVRTWGQPIIENPKPGIIGLLVRNGRNGVEILMQAKAEVGNRNIVQLAPTVQFTQSNYEGSKKLHKPFLFEEFSEPQAYKVIHESRQTEEGARFYREYHLHRVLMLPDDMELEIPVDYRWMPPEHIAFLLHLGEQVNSCARSILFCLLSGAP